MHLKIEELVDIAEGTRGEASAPHLASCATCRRQLADARAMLSIVSETSGEVPEPSPLFWDHLSNRVAEAAAVAPAPRRAWTGALAWPRLLMPALTLAMAALVIAVMVNSRAMTPRHAASPVPGMADASSPRELLGEAGSADDPSLRLVADLAGNMDSDAAGVAVLASRGSAEHAVTHLNDGELRELRRLLAEELAHAGA
jgi:hypothetical protein